MTLPFAGWPFTDVRRLARVRVSTALLAQLMTRGEEVLRARVVRGLPKGARLIHVERDSPWSIALVYEHAEFDAVAEGDEIPIIEVTYEAEWPEGGADGRAGTGA